LTLFLNNVIKKLLNLKSDEHIFKFLKAKFGFGATRDFDANLYLCEEAFGLLPFNTFGRLSDTLLFYAYVFVLSITVMAALAVAFHNLRYGMFQKPVLCFNELVLCCRKTTQLKFRMSDTDRVAQRGIVT